ncbi:MAG: PAS domain S-box protein [Chitinivibrionales bacterium]|nr:PAS domain S-box protein [Chitinivibrionales bacterium]
MNMIAERVDQSEENFRALAENSRDMIIRFDKNRRFVYANPAIESILCISPLAVLGKRTEEIGLPDDLVCLWDDAIDIVFESNTIHTIEFQMLSGAWIDWLLVPEHDPDGSISAVITTGRDITRYKVAEERLQANELRLKQTEEIALIGNVEIDVSSDLFTCSEGFCCICGLKPQNYQVSMEKFLGFIAPQDHDQFAKYLKDILINDQESTLQIALISAIQGLRQVAIKARILLRQESKAVKIILAIQDITELKRIENNQKLSDIRTRSLLYLNQMNDASLKQILDFALDTALNVTQSPIGYIYFYDEKKELFTLYAWSSNVMKECTIQAPQTTYELSKTGLWGEAVRQRRPIITNDYDAANPFIKGIPKGHVQLKRHMNLPIIDGLEIVAVIGVANKPTDYDENDINHCVILMDGVWKLKKRHEMEEQIRELNVHLENRVKKRTEELEKTLENLKKSEEKFRSLIININDGFFITDTFGTLTFANSALSQIHGYHTPDELVGRNFIELVKPDFQAGLKEMFTRSVRQRKNMESLEIPIIDAAGREKVVEMKASPIIIDNNLCGTQGVIRDVTENKKYESKIRQHSEFLSSILESLQYPFYVIDIKDDAIKIANSTALKRINDKTISCKALAGHRTRPCESENHPCPMDMVLKTKKPATAEHVQVIDGRDHFLEIHAYPVFDKLGNISEIIEYSLDITHRKEAEQKLNKALVELERSNKELEQFAYVASHDLQEPLRVIASYLQLLEKRYTAVLDEKGIDFISRAVNGSKRLQAIIRELLAYARISTTAKPSLVVDSQRLLERALEDLKITIANTAATIRSASLPKIRADENQVVMLFTNLIGNAIKYRKKDVPADIHISVKSDDTWWVFAVQDNGIGIEQCYYERIFQLFQRLHTRQQYEGLGIGLANCKKIIERHGGRIWVESHPGVGSTFFFTLPKAEPDDSFSESGKSSC